MVYKSLSDLVLGYLSPKFVYNYMKRATPYATLLTNQ